MAAKPPPLLLLLLLYLLLSIPQSHSQSTTPPEEEEKILLQIRKDWGNPDCLQSWTAATPHCNWTGITCDGTTGSVTGISLRSTNITDPIPSSICDLKSLSSLDLYYNLLPGPFPISLYGCRNLEYLDLSQNLFVGALPSDIDRLSPRLSALVLSANNFTADIPPSVGRLPALRYLYLDNNLFNGSFPKELADLSNLEKLYLAYNPFAPASIPPEFGNMSRLTYLFMARTNVIGEIPGSFSRLSRLQHLDLAMNSLTGKIPDAVWALESLQILYLYHNGLSGEINATGIRAKGLVSIDVSMNQLTGSIPEEFGELRNLSTLFMYYNQLSGQIPAGIGRLRSLQDVRLFNNNLTGALPPELGRYSELRNLEVDDNEISGELPGFLCAGGALTSLVVFDNHMTGTIPASLGGCKTLRNVQIYRNSFSGVVPDGIWSAVNLTTVIMHHNSLSGVLPDELPKTLDRLEIGSNRFTGRIPSSAVNLKVFSAGNNLFSGEIPASLARVSRLQGLLLNDNQISGEIPPSISTLRFLTALNLSNNRLSGEIPAAIGSLPVLTSLDLSANQLAGPIPPEIGNLKLNFLNLSSNDLSGEIPASLQNGAYDRSFLHNPGLCTTLKACRRQIHRSSNLSTALLAALLAAGLFLLLATLAIAYFLARDRKRRKQLASDSALWKVTSFHSKEVSFDNIIRGFTGENLIGSGGAGMVYKIALGDRAGEIVAVKKIWNSRKVDSNLEKEFKAEVQILGLIRHVNVVKLLCCISSDDSKLLVYEYMENGSLDQWLHPGRRPAGGSGDHFRPLDWPARLRIAVGAARGLCYMHNDCNPPIVHRDVKSSNILLDSELNAKIADFGLARILARGGEPESVSAIAGSFGYMAPECAWLRRVNEKVDVYSFGVVLLELVTGREANDGGENECLADWAWRRFQEGMKVVEAIDEEIRDETYLEEIEVVLKLGVICTGSLPSSRPTMKDVLQVLLRCDRTLALGGGGGRKAGIPGEYDAAPLLQMKKGSRRKGYSDTEENNGDNLVSDLLV